MGIMDEVEDKLDNKILQLNVGDVMILYTDGIVESWKKGTVKDDRDPEKDMFGDEKLIGILEKTGHMGSDDIKKAVFDSLKDYSLDDDVTLLVVKRTE